MSACPSMVSGPTTTVRWKSISTIFEQPTSCGGGCQSTARRVRRPKASLQLYTLHGRAEGLISAQLSGRFRRRYCRRRRAVSAPAAGCTSLPGARLRMGAGRSGILKEDDVRRLAGAVLQQCDDLRPGGRHHRLPGPTAGLTWPRWPAGSRLVFERRATPVAARSLRRPPGPGGATPLLPGRCPIGVARSRPTCAMRAVLFGGDFFRYLAFAEDPGRRWPEDFDWQTDPQRMGSTAS